ncbi:MAG: NADH-quinone oxidoreductase subunit C [Candidatus Ozemobacteraceae bacterium]
MKVSLPNVSDILVDNLLTEVQYFKEDGWRFVTMTCTAEPEAFDILYHFDKGYILKNIRLRLQPHEPLPSISRVFFPALVIENEIKDLFGIQVDDLLIDYEGRFLITEDAPQAPQSKIHGASIEVRVNPAKCAPSRELSGYTPNTGDKNEAIPAASDAKPTPEGGK